MSRIVTDYLDNIVSKFPEKPAFIDTRRTISFSELKKEAFSIAQKLIKEELFKAPVLVFMEKSTEMISSFMGIAYSGNFYSPLDTKMPEERISKITETLKPKAIITDKKHLSQVEQISKTSKIVVFEDVVEEECFDKQIIYNVTKKIIDTDILYVLFTSGSTGTPKGVIINHRAVVDYTDWVSDCYNFDENTIFANQAQLYFDLSIQDVYAPLRNGSTTVLIPNRLYTAPVRVWKLILEHKVNTLVWIPSMLSLFANLDILAHVEKANLKTVLFCGEVMPMKQLNYWIKHYPEVVYGNLYGPTECTDACTYYTVNRKFSDDDVLPMGKPCENSDAVIVDENGKIVTKPGEVGELFVRGTCMSMGYYGDPERTNEVFVQNPAHNDYPELVYKTGDLVTYNEFGELVYVSRKDFQIKIRGYRVELGEIDAAATAIDKVSYSCCLFDSKNEKLILVYTGDVSPDEVKSILGSKLQDYMIPTEYIKRDVMLFNVNGKIDRKALMAEYVNGR